MQHAKRICILLIIVVAALSFPGGADACPNCKYALEVGRAIAFGASVMLLMSMPFVIGAFWFIAIARSDGQPQSHESSEVGTP